MFYDVEVLETKRTIYRSLAANTPEEAMAVVEGIKEDEDNGEVMEVLEVEMDAYPSEELPEVE